MEILNLNTNKTNQNSYNKNLLTPEFIGSLIVYPIGFTHEKCLACDGYVLKKEDYQMLYSVIGSKFNDGTEAEDEFRIPDYNITKRFLQPSNTAGTKIEAGLPNITASVITSGANLSSVSGAFTASGSTKNRDDNLDTTGNRVLTFNASLSNSIYGNSTTVQPPSQLVHICIRYK